MKIQLIPANEYRRERWKNGAGWTREIIRWPEDSEAFDWRLSVAEVDKDGPFSQLPGIQRELVLLSGEGMHLDFDDGETVALLPPHDRIRFAGERSLQARLIAGPTQDFNIMWRDQCVDVSVLHRPLVGPMLFFEEAGVRWAIYVLSGRAMFKDQRSPMVLEQGDTALMTPHPGHGNRVILEGGGELLLIRLQTPADAKAVPVSSEVVVDAKVEGAG